LTCRFKRPPPHIRFSSGPKARYENPRRFYNTKGYKPADILTSARLLCLKHALGLTQKKTTRKKKVVAAR
jgi:hypothetical protein